MKYAVKVVWDDGSEEYLKEGAAPAIFPAKSEAQEMAEFMRRGMYGDEIQSINVVPAPSEPVNG